MITYNCFGRKQRAEHLEYAVHIRGIFGHDTRATIYSSGWKEAYRHAQELLLELAVDIKPPEQIYIFSITLKHPFTEPIV